MDLTDHGRRILEEVRPSFATVDAAIGTLRDQNKVQSVLKVASVHTLSYYFVSSLVKRFSARHAGIHLSVMARSSPEVVELVENGRADMGLVYDAAVASDKVVSTPLFDDEMCLVVGPGCPLQDGADLKQGMPKLVGFPPHYALRKMVHSSGLTPDVVAEVETVDAMLEMVASGLGCCILPQHIPDHILKLCRLRKVRIGSPRMSRRIVAIVRGDRQQLCTIGKLMMTAAEIAETKVNGSSCSMTQTYI